LPIDLRLLLREGELLEDLSPESVLELLPMCFEVMLPKVDKGLRSDYALRTITKLIEETASEMSDVETKDFIDQVVEKINIYYRTSIM